MKCSLKLKLICVNLLHSGCLSDSGSWCFDWLEMVMRTDAGCRSWRLGLRLRERERVDSTGDSPPTKNTTSDVIRRLFPREILRKGYNVHTAQSVTQPSNSNNIKIIFYELPFHTHDLLILKSGIFSFATLRLCDNWVGKPSWVSWHEIGDGAREICWVREKNQSPRLPCWPMWHRQERYLRIRGMKWHQRSNFKSCRLTWLKWN